MSGERTDLDVEFEELFGPQPVQPQVAPTAGELGSSVVCSPTQPFVLGAAAASSGHNDGAGSIAVPSVKKRKTDKELEDLMTVSASEGFVLEYEEDCVAKNNFSARGDHQITG